MAQELSNEMTLGLVQMHCDEDPKSNLARALELADEAGERGARVICLQELFRTLYFCQKQDHAEFRHAEPIPGPTTEALAPVARKYKAVIVAPIFEERSPGLYHNSAAVIGEDGRILGVYRKMHIPHDPNFEEKFYFAPGDRGFRTFRTRYGNVGVLICWDQWFPEGARLTALQGADVLLYPTAIGAHAREDAGVPERQLDAWMTVQRAHAIANGVFVAAANRVGKEGDVTFWGNSFVAGPFGEVIGRASGTKDEVLVVKLDRSEIASTRQAWPFLRDRRVDAYAGLSQRFLDGP